MRQERIIQENFINDNVNKMQKFPLFKYKMAILTPKILKSRLSQA